MTGLVDLLAAAVEVQRLCERHGWRFCFIGGIAIQRWGNPRFTVDVGLTLLSGYGARAPLRTEGRARPGSIRLGDRLKAQKVDERVCPAPVAGHTDRGST